LKIRDSCEKGWLSTATAVDSLLIEHGSEEARTHVDRRRKLKELANKLTEISRIGLYDRVEAGRSVLTQRWLLQRNTGVQLICWQLVGIFNNRNQ